MCYNTYVGTYVHTYVPVGVGAVVTLMVLTEVVIVDCDELAEGLIADDAEKKPSSSVHSTYMLNMNCE